MPRWGPRNEKEWNELREKFAQRARENAIREREKEEDYIDRLAQATAYYITNPDKINRY